jgi:hypothetical protein
MNFICSKITSSIKPSGAQIQSLQNPNNYLFAELDIGEICERISEGSAWRAGIYGEDTKDFKKTSVIGARIIALDFDCCAHEPEEIIDYAESIGFKPNIWYYSYSQGIKPYNNFRVLWILAEQITPKQYENIYIILLEQFAQFNPDKSTKDCSRLWFGSNREAVIVHRELTTLSGLGWLGVCEKTRAGIPTKDIRKNKGLLAGEYFEESLPEQIIIKKNWFEYLRTNCSLWDKWEKGEYLNYNQRLTLFTNLKFLKYTDKSIISDVLFFYNPDTYKGHSSNEEQIRSMLMNRTLSPRPIVMVGYEVVSIPEYFKRLNNGEEAKATKNTTPKIPLEDLDKLLTEKMPELLSRKGISYICSQTACGKTEHAIRWMLEQDLENKKIIYSVPTYNLMCEFYNRFTDAYSKKYQSDNQPITVIPKGNYSQGDLLLLELGMRPRTKQTERWKAIDLMLNENSKGVFVCSHQLLSHLKQIRADVIIIDENIEDALLDVVVYTQNGLSGLIPFIDFSMRDTLISFIDRFREAKRGAQIDLEPLQRVIETLNWNEYLNAKNKQAGIAKAFYVSHARVSSQKNLNTVRFTMRSTLISDALETETPIKLIGATPKKTALSSLYDMGSIDLYEFPKGINKGEIVQYIGITGAKGNNCSNIENLIKYVDSKLAPDIKESAFVLSFKDAVPLWESAGYRVPYAQDKDGILTPIHLANSAGLDFLKGKTVIVVGKYDDNDDVYIDKYYDLYPNRTDTPKRINQVVKLCDKNIKMYLWEDEQLRELQLEKYKQFTEQPAGRARALRQENAKVYLFSNYPIEDADIFKND